MSDEISFNRAMTFEYGKPSEMVPGVDRIVANNPGPFTFKGTNTYLIGSEALAVVDPGPDSIGHCTAILKAAAGRPITHILVTHTHRDHVDGLARLQAATKAVSCGFVVKGVRRGDTESSPSGTEFVERDFVPDIALGHGERVEAGDATLTALHTPGHAPDHLCYAVEGPKKVMLSGDHVMGWNTSVVAPPEGRMADYLASLELLLGRDDALFLPGHGGRIREPQRTVRAYLVHRRWREQAILDAIEKGHRTIRRIVPVVYRGLDPRLVQAAGLSVQAHVEHLLERRVLTCQGSPTLDRDLYFA